MTIVIHGRLCVCKRMIALPPVKQDDDGGYERARGIPDDYFTAAVRFPATMTNESRNSYKSMMKYAEFFNGKSIVGSVDITSFVRNLYFKTGIGGRPLSKKYISNILLVVLAELKRTGRLAGGNLDFKTLWSNIRKERTAYEKNLLAALDPGAKFSMLNHGSGYFKLGDGAVIDILNDCRRCLVLNGADPAPPRAERLCFAALLLAIGTGARVVSTILKLSRQEVHRLFDTGSVVCTAKHTNRCAVYIAECLRAEFRPYFVHESTVYPIPITRRRLVYWYRNYIMKKFGAQLPPGRILHEFRAWFVGKVNDTSGIREAARSVSHANVKTTLSYVNRSAYNVDVRASISKAFESMSAQ